MKANLLAAQVFLQLAVAALSHDESCVVPQRGGAKALSVLQVRQRRIGTVDFGKASAKKKAMRDGHEVVEEPADPDLSLPGNCGYTKECPLSYSLDDVNNTAVESWSQHDCNSEALATLHDSERRACEGAGDMKNRILEHGGWCYEADGSQTVNTSAWRVDMDYKLPLHHVEADEVIVSTLAEHVLMKEDGSCCYTLTDLGAGVGQYGHALRARLPELEYHGYDGAGNVEEFTGNYIRFADLTMPLSLNRTDWVMSAEVGEHIPHEHEAQVIANIHAHNCRGVILTWAIPGQYGTGHINCHSNEYIIRIFEGLGYKLNEQLTAALRAPRTVQNNWWFLNSSMAFDRIEKPASCAE